MAAPQYYIEQGVRRCVAAREACLPDIPAVVFEPGKPYVVTRIALDQLHSPKSSIVRDHRYIRNTEYPTQVLRTEPPAIHVEPLGLPGQTKAVPLSRVALL
jgi:hypothetical protein